MRILRLIPYFADGFGGPVNHVKMLTKELDQEGHETVIYTTNLSSKEGRIEPDLGNGYDVRAFPVRWSVGDYFYTPGMKRALRSEEFDLVHAHCYRNYQADLGAWISRIAEKPLVFTAHGTLPKLPNLKDRFLKGVYDAFAGRKVLKTSRAVVALSLREMNQYRHMRVPHERIVRIYHGVDSQLFRPMNDANPLELGSNGGPLVLYVGRIHRRKGLQFLVRAFHRVLREFPDASLVICGPDYGYKNHLLRLVHHLAIEDRILFLGSVEHESLPAIYAASDIVALPSRQEIFGHALAEAASCGKAIIATKWGWAAEFFVDREDSMLLGKYGEVSLLSQALLELLRDSDFREQLGRAARRKVLTQLSWEVCTTDHVRTYKQVLDAA